jgi:3-dehydroquinate dehydratase-2
MKNILIINGPNLNLLGKREPKLYGEDTLDQINTELEILANSLGARLTFFCSNSEGEIIDCIQDSQESCDGLIINAGAYSHYSIAIRDAIEMLDIPVIELHITNIFAREEFRRVSVLSPVCSGIISGFGKNSYFLALTSIMEM